MRTNERFSIKLYTNPGGQSVWRVQGRKADGQRVRENFQSQTEAKARKGELMVETMTQSYGIGLKQTRLTDEQLAQAEAAFLKLGGQPLLAAFQETGAQASLPANNHFIPAPALLERVWPDERSRPSLRWLREQQRVHAIPSTKVGRRVLFCAAHVLAFAGSRRTLLPQRQARPSCGPAQIPTPDTLMDAVGLLEFLLREYGLKRSMRWVRQQQEDRTLPFVRWGRKVFFSPAQVAATLQKQ